MRSPTEWRMVFQDGYARAVSNTTLSGMSFDMNKFIEDLVSDVQDDALGLPPVERPNYGVVTKREAEEAAVKSQQ